MKDTIMTKPWNSGQESIRSIEIGGKQWFIAEDVANAFGIKNVRKNLLTIHPLWKKEHYFQEENATLPIISEEALYKLVFRCKKRSSELFTDWIASAILPVLKKRSNVDPLEFIALPNVKKDKLIPLNTSNA